MTFLCNRHLAACLWLAMSALCTPAAADSLRERVEALAAAQHFSVEGLSILGTETAAPADGSPADQLRRLLRGYNYVATQGPGGRIDSLRILGVRGEHRQPPGSSATVETKRVGSHHQVNATLIGPNHVSIEVPLLVDTGATTIVLPSSMMSELGFNPESLQDGKSQTAGGEVSVKIGILPEVRVGQSSASQVQVSFIPDAKIKDARLLGMSFLQRFRLTIDDARNELVLMAR